MSDYLSEPTLAEVFPSTLTVNGTAFSLDSTDSLQQGGLLEFQWGLYLAGSDWVIRICKPDNSFSPTEYLYDQIAATDAEGATPQIWALACIVQCSTLWND